MNFTPAESLHRLVKLAIDSGAAATVAEAEATFHGYNLAFSLNAENVNDPHHQAALLTGIALARRVFLGTISVMGLTETPLAVPLPFGMTLTEAVIALGGSPTAPTPGTPQITIGGPPLARSEPFHVRAIFGGWRGGIVPAHSDIARDCQRAMPLAPMLSVALAVNEAFLHVQNETPAAGSRAIGLSLWDPAPACDWLATNNSEPELRYLPTRIWMLGMGHLGQAFLWGLGLLPYPDESHVKLVFQDVDVITPSSHSTSILTTSENLGQRKTRVLAAWAERRGFEVAIHERLFDASFRRQRDEPAVALCGFDNAIGRRALDEAGFDLVVEAGLGRGWRDFRSIRVHTLPGSRRAIDIWKLDDGGETVEHRPAYQNMLQKGELDRCGITILAGKAVGAPFVGAVAASLGLSELLRLFHGGPLHQIVDLDLRSVEYRSVVPQILSFSHLNPGYTLVA